MKKIFLATIIGLSLSNTVSAAGMFSDFKDKVADEWSKSMAGKTDLYLPFKAWHNREYYDREDRKDLNEQNYGIGFGKSYLDEEKDWHGFYAMAFSDSHKSVEPIIGYAYTKNWYKNDAFVGIGYTALITARKDLNYVPLPGVLPVVSAGYKDMKVSGTYVPGGNGYGNVAFFWGTLSF